MIIENRYHFTCFRKIDQSQKDSKFVWLDSLTRQAVVVDNNTFANTLLDKSVYIIRTHSDDAYQSITNLKSLRRGSFNEDIRNTVMMVPLSWRL